MKTRITFITLGVSDLNRSLSFYRDGLGFSTKGIVGTEFEDGAVVFFNLNNHLILSLYPRESLAKDAHIVLSEAEPVPISIGHNVGSKEEVDDVMQQARQAGARITDPAHDRFWGGYSGYFQDPDGYLWEIAWAPGFEIEE